MVDLECVQVFKKDVLDLLRLLNEKDIKLKVSYESSIISALRDNN